MPTTTFYNLNEEKKQKLIQSALREFSRVPFEDVSINQIIKDAGISRGSFYMYFEDKKDLCLYLLSQLLEKFDQYLDEMIVQSKRNPFEICHAIFQYAKQYLLNTPYQQFIVYQFHRIKIYNRLDEITDFCQYFYPQFNIRTMLNELDTSCFAYQDEADCKLIMEILLTQCMYSIMKMFEHPQKEVEIEQALLRKYQMIQNGILK